MQLEVPKISFNYRVEVASATSDFLQCFEGPGWFMGLTVRGHGYEAGDVLALGWALNSSGAQGFDLGDGIPNNRSSYLAEHYGSYGSGHYTENEVSIAQPVFVENGLIVAVLCLSYPGAGAYASATVRGCPADWQGELLKRLPAQS